jgi:hypothetical protein
MPISPLRLIFATASEQQLTSQRITRAPRHGSCRRGRLLPPAQGRAEAAEEPLGLRSPQTLLAQVEAKAVFKQPREREVSFRSQFLGFDQQVLWESMVVRMMR